MLREGGGGGGEEEGEEEGEEGRRRGRRRGRGGRGCMLTQLFSRRKICSS
jgi:hypothetical protein